MPEKYYSDEHVTLYHGDCLEVTAWLEADVLVTDPPYGQDIRHEFGFTRCGRCGASSRSRYGICRGCRVESDALQIARVTNDSDTAMRDAALERWGVDRPALVFGTWKTPRPRGIRALLVWDKGNSPGPGDLTIPWGLSSEEIYLLGKWSAGGAPTSGRSANVVRVPRLANGAVEKPDHPTPKPVPLMERLIEKCPLGLVADPFAGSGATLLAARNLNRRAIGVEIEERYCELIASRLAQGCLDFGEGA